MNLFSNIFIVYILVYTVSAVKLIEKEQPTILSVDGNLIFVAAQNRHIKFQIDSGSVFLNDEDLLLTLKQAANVTKTIGKTNDYFAEYDYQLKLLQNTVKYNLRSNNNTTPLYQPNIYPRIRRLNRKLIYLTNNLKTIEKNLLTDECAANNPCQNGAVCIDMYQDYKCLCPTNWEGKNCNKDVNECIAYSGTDLGCQNGATCYNTPGSFRCVCQKGWFGADCTQKTSDCSAGSDICSHGTCIPAHNDFGYKCICDQGWTTDGFNMACTVDVDECTQNHPSCSVNPKVDCINLPGSFRCGSCPMGYTGNGYFCVDSDECTVNNGGCSLNPYVQCINTMGSRICGSCPPGYLGDGVTCSFKGVCNVNNGGCHHMAECQENFKISATFVECICPFGYVGNGIGPNGCTQSIHALNPCFSSPCINGFCTVNNVTGYVCKCNKFYSGRNCEIRSVCSSNPCLNGGTCFPTIYGYAKCTCPEGFTGASCENQKQVCGGRLKGELGTLRYPPANYTYVKSSCAWTIETLDNTKVLNITFKKFQMARSCLYDWLQIHDGKNSAAHPLGRFCGSELPNNGTIVSTHNKIYLWFRSDHPISGGGFELSWNTTNPVCGETKFVTSHGSIQSPGYPGNYPNNRVCSWFLGVPSDKRLLFHFFTLDIGQNPNCNHDYLEFFSSLSFEEPFAKYCNTSRPSPLYSLGDIVRINFVSDDVDPHSGFLITYSVVEGIPGCGGTYNYPQGEISSPTLNGKYLPNLRCEYKIIQPSKTRIKITFISFNIETSLACHFDNIAIYEGTDSNSNLVGRYCGSKLPAPYISYSNSITVVFETDFTTSNEGFKFKYELVCGGVFTESSGTITSPGYPQKYPMYSNCIYEINQPTGKIINLYFFNFSIGGLYPKCGDDFLEIRDGDNGNSTLIGRYCYKPPPVIISTHNYLWLLFSSGNDASAGKFSLFYNTTNIGCGGIMKDSVGTISTPSLKDTNTYTPGILCKWIIIAPPESVIQLTWMTFNIENSVGCTYDHVSVFDNNTETGMGGLMGTYCGNVLPPTLLSSSNVMTIIFTSDSTINLDGLLASYTFLQERNVCGGNYFTNSGVIKSPEYPSFYPPNKQCVWTITVPPGRQILLNITHFDLESYSNCRYDWLEIRNGGTLASPLIGRYCGTKIPTLIPSQSNKLHIKFNSDLTKTKSGFYIVWSSTATGCGGSITSPTGSIISPHYPEPYSRNTECYWKITVSLGSRIQLVFADIDMENQKMCVLDFVEIFDGPTRTYPSLGRFCTNTKVPFLLSTDNNVFIRFRSDVSFQGRGFNLKYSTVCNNTLTGFNGVIESTNFPNGYPQDQNCLWHIKVHSKNKIQLVFSDFELERSLPGNNTCSFDYVEISYFNSDDDVDEEYKEPVRYGIYCGDKNPGVVLLPSDHVQIHFVSDQLLLGSGFRLEWQLIGCGGELTHPTGSIMSPNYPLAYPNSVECAWTIRVDFGKSVQITFREIDVERDIACEYDSVSIYNGPDSTHNLLAKLCHQDKKTVITSSSNEMYIHFKADQSYRGKGFTADYKTLNTACGGLFTAPFGSINSPNYPKNYNKNDTCFWLIDVDDNHVIELVFDDVDLINSKSCSDYILVYDGPSEAYPVLQQICGNNKPNNSIVSTYNHMFVEFHTNAYITSKGFHANYYKQCGARIIATGTGQIQYSLHTQHHTNCSWTIIASELSQHVSLTFGYLNTVRDYCPDTDFDSPVRIYNGETSNSPMIGQYCLSKIPPMIVSDGAALHIEILWKVDFEATYSVLDSHCGGTLLSIGGNFASPGFPKSYIRNRQCEWTLDIAEGNHVTLSFTQFNLPESENCNTDYLEIRSKNSSGTLLGVFCGKNRPINITHEGDLWLMYQSSNSSDDADNNNVRYGFAAEYELEKLNELVEAKGVIETPNYPKFLSAFGTYSWKITVSRWRKILIKFNDFYFDDDECYYSSLNIYDGTNDEAPSLGIFCGYNLPNSIVTTSSNVYIVAICSSVRMGSRASIEWSEVPTMYLLKKNKTIATECGSNDTVDMSVYHNFTLTSPGYPNGYAPFLNCEWNFFTNPQNHLSLYFTDLHLRSEGPWMTSNCYGDYVQLFTKSATDNDWVLEQKICKKNTTKDVFFFTNLLKIVFITNGYRNGTGFRAYIREYCGGSLTAPSGIITLNNFTRHYECQWNITVRAGRTIKLSFIKFNITRGSPTVCNNYLLIRNGKFPDSPLLGDGKYCGSTIPSPLNTIGNHMYIKYKGPTNAIVTLKYEEISVECGGNIILTNFDNFTEISSPNYPNIPTPHTECSWTIRGPPGEILQIDFEDRFDLTVRPNCTSEFVEIRNGGTEFSPLIDRFCNTTPSSQYSTDNMMFVKFFTDIHDPRNGFKAKISISVCGGTFRGTEDEIYGKIVGGINSVPNCTWNIIAPENHILTLHFTKAETNNADLCSSASKVIIVEKLGLNKKESVFVYCKSKLPRDLEFSSNEVQIIFDVENKYKNYDFVIKYTAQLEECGGRINTESGFIQSPGYPQILQRTCHWIIEVPFGRRITLEFLDYDLDDQTDIRDQGIGIFNGKDFNFRIAMVKASETRRIFESSQNEMMIYFWSIHYSHHRGFKAKFTSNNPTICEGYEMIGDSGLIQQPSEAVPYSCTYIHRMTQTNYTVAYSVNIFTKTQRVDSSNCKYTRMNLIFLADETNHKTLKEVCSSTTKEPVIVRTPFKYTRILARSGIAANMNFSISFDTYPCGGTFTEPEGFISSPDYLTKLKQDFQCSWLINLPSDGSIKINVTNFDLGDDCKKNYLTIYNGHLPTFPRIGKYCEDNKPTTIITQYNQVWIEYFVSKETSGKGFYLSYESRSEGCGGIFHDKSKIIQTPNYGKQYPNNAECLWEIVSPPGYFISLRFIDRFFIEQSTNCVNDFVEVSNFENDSWKSIMKLCGRNLPNIALNSTTNRMKILFRSNNSTGAAGFKAKWSLQCGGTFDATKTPKRISSPNYPISYSPRLKCEYRIVAARLEVISLEFLDFDLEKGLPQCLFDNVTISSTFQTYYYPLVFCGSNKPAIHHIKSTALVTFSTDGWLNRKGFLLEYKIDDCNNTISSETYINYDKTSKKLRCFWYITAPPSKIIVLKLQYLQSWFSNNCRRHQLSVYDGFTMYPNANRLAVLCGQIKNTTIIHSKSNRMLIMISPGSLVTFKADVEFSYGPEVGCGGDVKLKDIEIIKSPNVADPTCIWSINTYIDNIISIQFNDVNLPKNCSDQDSKGDPCNCGSLEIRDGASHFAELIANLCGNYSTLPEIRTTTNVAYIKLSYPGQVNNAVKLTLKSVQSKCGHTFLNVTKTIQRLTSPGYPNPYETNMRCKWILSTNQGTTIWLHFEDLDLTEENVEDNACNQDRIEITDPNNHNVITEGLGPQAIVSNQMQRKHILFYNDLQDTHVYCGKTNKTFDYYSFKNVVMFNFISRSAQKLGKGFSVQYATTGCNRNYTSVQGRLIAKKLMISDCIIIIEVPMNRTISLYFRSFSTYLSSNCKERYLEVRENNSSGLVLAKMCGYLIPNQIFSQTNKLWLKISGSSSRPITYDATYTSSDKGRGCGGEIYNYKGKFTSPMYPKIYKNDSLCIWEVSVPRGLHLGLQFTVFSLEASCSVNYLKVTTYLKNGDSANVKFCKSDYPGTLYSFERVTVTYQASQNNDAIGWSALFNAFNNDIHDIVKD